MNLITLPPYRDLDWLDSNAEAARANAVALMAALELIALTSTDLNSKHDAHAALNRVFAWRAPAQSTAIAEEN